MPAKINISYESPGSETSGPAKKKAPLSKRDNKVVEKAGVADPHDVAPKASTPSSPRKKDRGNNNVNMF